MNNIFRLIFNPQQRENQKLQYQTAPNPEEMLKVEEAEKKYRGWMVDWNVTIQSMYNDFDPKIIVVLTSFGTSSASIWLSVAADSNPEIYDHGSGSQLNVKGEVNTIQGKNIYLDKCQVQF